MERCNVCGSQEISRFWSFSALPLVYCSFRCRSIGTRFLNLFLGILLGLFLLSFPYGVLEPRGSYSNVYAGGHVLFFILWLSELYLILIVIYGFWLHRNKP